VFEGDRTVKMVVFERNRENSENGCLYEREQYKKLYLRERERESNANSCV
jgi:hypothetical protein